MTLTSWIPVVVAIVAGAAGGATALWVQSLSHRHRLRESQLARWHERQAKALAHLFRLLVETDWAFEAMAETRNYALGEERAKEAEFKAMRFQDGFWRNYFLFQEALCEQIRRLLLSMHAVLQKFRDWVTDPNPTISEEVEDRRAIVRQFADETRPLFREIEREFRQVTGVPQQQRSASWPQRVSGLLSNARQIWKDNMG